MANVSEAFRTRIYTTFGITGGNELVGILNSVDVLSATEAGYLDGAVPGTAAANKVLVLGSSKEIATITSATITTLTASSIISGAGNGSSAVTDMDVTETGGGVVHKTVLDFSSVANQTVTRESGDDSGWMALKTYDFPAGRILVLGVTVDLTLTAVTNIDSSAQGDFAMGTTGTADTTLTGTDVDLCPSTAMTFSLDIASAEAALAASAQFDGTSSAKDAYLNLIFDVGDVTTGDGVVMITGTITITWINLGDY